MARVRTFIAIDIDKPIRDRAVSLQENLARSATDVKWVEPANLHVTLLFLGEVDDREVIQVCRAVGDCCASRPPFAMSIETVGCFPNPRRPRVLWVGVGEGASEITELHDALELPLLELGCYRKEDRKFTPHITLGRVKSEGPAENLAQALVKYSRWHAGTTMVHQVLVMASELSSSGPVYSVLSRARLSASPTRESIQRVGKGGGPRTDQPGGTL